MYKVVIPEDTALVTDYDDKLIPKNLKLLYDLSLQFLESKKRIPVKPDDVDQKEWEETGWDEALARLIKKTHVPNNKKTSGFIDIAVLPWEAHEFIKFLNLNCFMYSNLPNRKQRRYDARLNRAARKRKDEGDSQIGQPGDELRLPSVPQTA